MRKSNKRVLVNALWVVLVPTFVVLIGVIWTKTWNLGSRSDHYQVVCIHGHQYYRANFAAKMGIAPRLNDNGTPVKCEVD